MPKSSYQRPKKSLITEILKAENENTKVPKRRVKKNINELQEGDYYRGTVKILRIAKPGPTIINVFDGTGTIEAIAKDRVFERTKRAQIDLEQNDERSDPLKDSLNKKNIYQFGNLIIKDNRNKNKSAAAEKEKGKVSGKKNDASSLSEKDKGSDEYLKEEDLHVDDTIFIFGKAEMHRNKLEIHLKSIRKPSLDFEAIINAKSKPARDEFSIDSERYEAMKPIFIAVAQRIRLAIIEQQPILIRHHNDADGICSGLAIEQAILNVMDRRNIEPKNLLYRSASTTPFYDQIDLFRDLSKFTRYHEIFGDRSPLVLLLDTGSTPENLFAVQILQSFGFECIVIDHHNPGEIKGGKSVICDYLEFHLNPYLFGYDSQTSGGMLSYELARFIDEEFEEPLLPAVAGVGDRCDIPELDQLIEKSGKSQEELLRMAMVLDYLAYNFKFDSGDAVYDKVFVNERFVEVISIQVEYLYQKALKSLIPILKSNVINGICYTELDLELYTIRGKYPTAGKILGLAHDYIAAKEDNQDKPVLTAGYFKDGIIFRATEPVVPVPTLLKKLQEEIPEAMVEGGGHEQAGSLKFLPAYFERVHNFVLNEVKNAQY